MYEPLTITVSVLRCPGMSWDGMKGMRVLEKELRPTASLQDLWPPQELLIISTSPRFAHWGSLGFLLAFMVSLQLCQVLSG